MLVVYGRPGCHLCDEAVALLEPLATAAGVALDQVDIERDDALHTRLLERIPVIEFRGEQLAQLDEFRADGFAERVAALVRDSY